MFELFLLMLVAQWLKQVSSIVNIIQKFCDNFNAAKGAEIS